MMKNLPLQFASLSLLASSALSAATGSAAVTRDISKMDKAVLAVQPLYSQTGSLKSTIPAKMKAGQNGYLIATSEYIKKNSKELAAFIKHKESRGFKVHVATEKDWGLSEAGKGRHQADLVHKWMRENYKKLNLLYTLVISNPHPDEGMVPMVKFKPHKVKVISPEDKKKYTKYLKYKDNPKTEDGLYYAYDGGDPSDYYYADLTSNWDANGNSVLADKEDYKMGEIDATVEVYVGRIPYYGEEHAYSNLAGVDKILRRTIDYERSNAEDTSWRNNLFYVGGADKRFIKIQEQFMPYNGGVQETYRTSLGYGYEPHKTKWSGEVILNALQQDKPYGFINFQEHGSPTSMAGQISTQKAMLLKRSKPGYVYLGGCDVASPEHSDNVTNALFNHIGIAAVGASRSVTAMGGDDDTDSAASYERLFFGQSTGEAHWQLLSDYADGMKKVGASNFLMNLMGDPSVVVFPKFDEDPLVVGPKMETLRYYHQERNKTPVGQVMIVRNQTGEARDYSIATEGALIADTKGFKLAPYSSRPVRVLFKDAYTLEVGKHAGTFLVKTGSQIAKQKFEVDIYARTTLLSLNFDNPEARKILRFDAKGDKLEMLKKMIVDRAEDDYLHIPKGTRGDLARTKIVPGESDVTVAARLRYESNAKGLLQFLNFGKTFQCFDASIENGKFYVLFRTLEGDVETEDSLDETAERVYAGTEAKIEVPAPNPGEWFQMIASVNRSEKKMTLNLNGKEYTTKFEPNPGQSLTFARMRLGYGKNKSEMQIDDLAVFDYALGEKEIAALAEGDIIKQVFPQNGDKANPKGVNLSWEYSGKQSDLNYVLVYATDAKFSDRKFIKTKDTAATISGLKDNTNYFWKVGYMKGEKMYFPWDSYTTFITDGSIEEVEVTVNERAKMAVATVGDSNYSANLAKGVRALLPPDSKGKRKRAELFFAKVDGDDWLRCHSDGTLTTNHGAPKSGTYKFTFSVSTRYGTPQTFERTIIAK